MNANLIRLLFSRTLLAAVTLLVVSAVVFLGTELLPGNAARAALGPKADPTAVEALAREFNLDRPAPERYMAWLANAAKGDFGRSIPSGQPVWSMIGSKIWNTVALTVGALAILIPLSLGLGILSAVKRDSWIDHLISLPTLIVVALPEFVIGTIFIVVVAVGLNLVPPVSLLDSGTPMWRQLDLLVLPVLTLVGATLAQVVRMVRAVTIDVLQSEFVYMVRLRGLSASAILIRHVLPNVLGPSIQTIALNASWLAGGVVVTESVFQLPGLGSALADAVINRDLPTVEAIAMIITASYVAINLVAELMLLLLNPRLRVSK